MSFVPEPNIFSNTQWFIPLQKLLGTFWPDKDQILKPSYEQESIHLAT